MSDTLPTNEFEKQFASELGKESAKHLLGFISDIVRPPAKELGGLLADKVAYHRFKNQIEILQKAKELIDKHHINTQKVPTKFLANFLNYASWEENQEMKDRWSTLLSNCATEGTEIDITMSFPNLLNELSPLDAKTLDTIYDELFFPARRQYRKVPSYQSTQRLSSYLNIDLLKTYVVCDNLERLNLILVKQEYKHEERDIEFSQIEKDYDEISLTYLGNEFVKKCRVPFSENHSNKIRESLKSYVVEIAKKHDGPSFEKFCEEAKKTYPHIIQNDLNGGVHGALDKYIWKGGKIKDFEGHILSSNEKINIENHCMTFININNRNDMNSGT